MKKKDKCEYFDKMSLNGYVNIQNTLAPLDKESEWSEKPKRIVCPKCKRRLMSAVRYNADGDEVYHCVPPHKKKKWWKKKVKK